MNIMGSCIMGHPPYRLCIQPVIEQFLHTTQIKIINNKRLFKQKKYQILVCNLLSHNSVF
jgi:hypothetical protein